MTLSTLRLSVVIPTWNAAELTSAAIRHLNREGRPSWAELIVVDDGSDDDTVTLVRSDFPDVIVIRHDSNRGFGAAVNSGFRAARGAYLAALNNDALVSWEVLDRLTGVLRAQPRAAAAAPRIVGPDGRPQQVGFELPALPWVKVGRGRLGPPAVESSGPVAKGYLKGACVVFTRRALEEVGLFDEQFHMFAEEIDLFQRLARAGWEAWVVPDVEATHLAGATTRNHAEPAVAARFRVQSYRSMCLYYEKHFSWSSAAILRAVLAIRVAGRFVRSLTPTGRGWREPRGGREQLRCVAAVLSPCVSRPVEPTLDLVR